MNTIQLKIDKRIIGKNGLLLFTQRHLLDCFIEIENLDDETAEIKLTPKQDGSFPSSQELNNELLECEFLSSRYEQTKELREAIIDQIRSINKSDVTGSE